MATIDALAQENWLTGNRASPKGSALLYHKIPQTNPPCFVYDLVIPKDPGVATTDFFPRGEETKDMKGVYTRAYNGTFDFIKIPTLAGATAEQRCLALRKITETYIILCREYWKVEQARPIASKRKKSVRSI